MTYSATNETMEKAKEIADQWRGKASGIMRGAQETAGKWTHKVQDNLESLTDTASGYAKQGREKAEALGRTVSGQVQERPVSALLLAAGLGFLLGVFLLRRSRPLNDRAC
jgi:ElaB/YqjD/DUF883 family membrane-anchored ribosome-binding protein